MDLGVDPSAVATEPFRPPPASPTNLSSKELKDLKPGTQLGDFRIDSRLGVGGMAGVYLADRGVEQVAL